MSVTAKALIEAKFASNSPTSEYTAPAVTRTIIDKLTATNTDVGAQTVSINIVPLGQTPTSSNALMIAKSITAGSTYDFVEVKNHILNAGDYLSIFASAASVMSIRASGREVA